MCNITLSPLAGLLTIVHPDSFYVRDAQALDHPHDASILMENTFVNSEYVCKIKSSNLRT